MVAARRVYVYLVAFISLQVAAWGAAALGRALVESLFPGGIAGSGLRRDVAWNGALLIVGVPIWLLHWAWAARLAARDPTERGATLRRLYVYAVLATMLIAVAGALQNALEEALRALMGVARVQTARAIAGQVPWLVVGAALWAYHRRVATADRQAVGERGGAATLRRWYSYGAAFIALLYLLSNTARVLRLAWESAAGAFTGMWLATPPPGLAGASASTLVAVAVWLSHWQLWAPGRRQGSGDHAPRSILDQDRSSTLRAVYLFGALAVSVGASLAGLSQLLYYALGRLLGVSDPGGVGGNLMVAMAGPASTALIYAVSWRYQRRALAAQAASQAEQPRQAGVRRFYTYLVALLAMGVLASGAGGVLWTLADLATSAPRAAGSSDWWREQISLYATLLAVGLPVWALHWGPVADQARRPGEAASLARRIYLYVTLGAAVLALLGAGVAGVRVVLGLALGEAATASAVTDLARAISVGLVAALVVYYHQGILRRDIAAQAAAVPPAPAQPAARAAVPADGGPGGDRPFGVVYRSAGVEQSAWFGHQAEAEAAAQRLRAAPAVPDWLVVVRVADATTNQSGGPANTPDPAGGASA
jgi:hypothetical protein